MDNMTWYKGKMLKRQITETHPDLGLPHLAVVMILAAREQGLSLDDIVQQLILADGFAADGGKSDRDATLRELGY